LRDRLNSWKEIAAYLGRSERTVRRWEEKEGLPVRRLQHEQRGSVYGYRDELDSWMESRKPGPDTAPECTVPAKEPLSRWLWIAAAGLVAAGAAILASGGPAIRGRPVELSSIAVLPFENLSGNPDEEWFSDGMTEALISEIARIRGLKVISRTSAMRYKGAKKPLNQIATELKVGAIVEGSALRAGDRVRITVQLIETATDTHLWATDFERDIKDALSAQREVAQAIAREVGSTVAARLPSRGPSPAHPEAMAAYLKGLYQFNRGDPTRAIALAREAIRLDPGMARSHELLGSALIISADFHRTTYRAVMPEAQAALDRALALEPDRGASLSWLGWSYFVFGHDWIQAESKMRRGFELDPATGNNYAWLLAAQGRFDDAIRVVDKALLHDPANPVLIADSAHIHHMTRRYDDAVRLFRRSLELSPDNGYALAFLPKSLRLANRPDEAFEAFTRVVGKDPDAEAQYRKRYSEGGWPAVWQLYLEGNTKGRGPAFYVHALIALNRKQEAMDGLEALEETSDSWLVLLGDAVYDPIRQEPRFKALLQRVGYPRWMW
jgi:TolB-like protein/Tfp pilus assembly protein PilF